MNPSLAAAYSKSAAQPSKEIGPVAECPVTRRYAIEAQVIGVDGAPFAGIAVQLLRSPREVSGQVSDVDSPCRFDGLIEGSYEVTLPDLDRDAWKLLRVEALDANLARSEGDMTWAAPPEPARPLPPQYEVQPGDCLSNIGFRAGFAPDTIWQDGANETLRSRRKTAHILLPGDKVAIPERRPAKVPVSTGQRCVLQLLAVPEILRIRFLTYTEKPRKGVPYLLQITTADGAVLPDRKGQTGADGFLIEPIAPNAMSGEVWLGQGIDREVIPLRLGRVDPIDSVRGLQARLTDLNYLCGEEIETGEFGELTRDALQTFQREHCLEVTGERDPATLARLEQVFLS